MPSSWGSPAQCHQPQATALQPCGCCIGRCPVATDLSPSLLSPKGHRQELPSPAARKEALMVSQPPGPQPAVPGAPHLLGGSTTEQGQVTLMLLGLVASPVLVASCNNCHRKRKCCTMTWGRREPRGESHSDVRAAIPPLAVPTTLVSWHSPLIQPSTVVATSTAGAECPGHVPRAKSGNSSLKYSSEHGRSCLEWNCPPAPTGPTGTAQLLLTLTPATEDSTALCIQHLTSWFLFLTWMGFWLREGRERL